MAEIIRQTNKASYKILLDSLYQIYKTKTDHKYALFINNKQHAEYLCGLNDDLNIELDLNVNRLNQLIETAYTFELTVCDRDGVQVEILFKEKAKWKPTKNGKRQQTLPSRRREAKKKYCDKSLNDDNK